MNIDISLDRQIVTDKMKRSVLKFLALMDGFRYNERIKKISRVYHWISIFQVSTNSIYNNI